MVINVWQPFYTFYLVWYPSLLGIFQHLSHIAALKLCDTRLQVKYALEYTLEQKWPAVFRRFNTRNALWPTPLCNWLSLMSCNLFILSILFDTQVAQEYFNTFHTSQRLNCAILVFKSSTLWSIRWKKMTLVWYSSFLGIFQHLSYIAALKLCDTLLETSDPSFLGGSILAMHFELFCFGIYAGIKLTRLL